MRKRALALIIVWVAVTAMAFWGLPSSNQTPMAAMWLALSIAAGPLARLAHHLHNGAGIPSLVWASLALICAAVAMHAWRRSSWSFVLLAMTWCLSGFMFSVGIFI